MEEANSKSGEGGQRTAQLRAQKQRGFYLLRFAAVLEPDFRRYYCESGRPFRLILLFLALLAVSAQPFYGWFDEQQASEYFRALWLFLFALEIAALVAALVVTVRGSLQQHVDRVLGIAALLLACILLLQRALGSLYGLEIPLELTGIIIVAVFFIARLPFRTFLPFAVAIIVAMVVNEWTLAPPHAGNWVAFLPVAVLVGVAFVGGYAQEYMARNAWLDNALLTQMSEMDGLTGLLNHRAVHIAAQRSCDQAAREGVPIGLAMVDIDHFKVYNDNYGHKAGDECLGCVADKLRAAARRSLDCVGRLGGEEFLLVWYGAEPLQVEHMAAQLLDSVRSVGAADAGSESVTVSLGVVTLVPGRGVQASELIEAADALMYRAKAAGRDQMAVEHRAQRPAIDESQSDVLA